MGVFGLLASPVRSDLQNAICVCISNISHLIATLVAKVPKTRAFEKRVNISTLARCSPVPPRIGVRTVVIFFVLLLQKRHAFLERHS
jgi:hypothetical protein